MSRDKPSGVVSADGRIKRTIRYKRYNPQTVVDRETGGTLINLMRVPSITINPKGADGYRSPSNYYGYPIVRDKRNYPHAENGRAFVAPLDSIFRDGGSLGPWDNSKTDWFGEGTGIGYTTAPVPTLSRSDVNALRTKILNNINDEKFDVAMLLADIGKTASTASGLLHRIGRSMTVFQKKNPKSFAYLWHGKLRDNRRPTDRFLRETAGAYLEWKYGIMPTVYDLQAMTEQLDANAAGKSLFDNPPLMVCRATIKKPVQNISCLTVLLGGHNTSGTVRTTYSARADFSVDSMGLRGLNQYGLGLTSLATVAYDLTPFSFVFNMAVPMAELIKAWGALAHVSVRGYTETVHHEFTVPEQRLNLDTLGGLEPPITVMAPGVKFNRFTRTGSGTIPMPLPHIRNPVSVGNVSTVLSLFTTLRAKSKL